MTFSSTDTATALFGPTGSFLHATLRDSVAPAGSDWVALPGGAHARSLDAGVLEIAAQQSRGRVLLSAGVHGNETAPVEILDFITSKLVAGELVPRRDLMLILANPPALRAGQRFVTENMNRLFIPNNPEPKNNEEQRRAGHLMEHAASFLTTRHGEAPLHLDLHTAILGSHYRRFTICPDPRDSAARHAALVRLMQWGIEAVVISSLTGSTFSAWSANTCGARSFTLELGRALPLGENDLNDFSVFTRGLCDYVRGDAAGDADGPLPAVFRVNREIRRRGGDFRLHLPGNVENFTALDAGALIATDDDLEIRAQQGEHLLFPNASVPIGQRALVLIVRDDNLS